MSACQVAVVCSLPASQPVSPFTGTFSRDEACVRSSGMCYGDEFVSMRAAAAAVWLGKGTPFWYLPGGRREVKVKTTRCTVDYGRLVSTQADRRLWRRKNLNKHSSRCEEWFTCTKKTILDGFQASLRWHWTRLGERNGSWSPIISAVPGAESCDAGPGSQAQSHARLPCQPPLLAVSATEAPPPFESL